MDEARHELALQQAWLRGRAQHLARRFRPGATKATLDDFAHDLFSEAVLRFLASASRGWFDQRPRVNLEAQVRHLLQVSLMQAATDVLRYEKKNVPMPDSVEPDHGGPHGDGGAAEAIDRGRERELLRDAVHRLNPARRLWYLAVHRPEELTAAYVLEAARFRKGGGVAVRRPAEEAWELFRRKRDDPAALADAAGWKRTVAEIFRLATPLGAATSDDVQRAVNSIDVQLSRAMEQILEMISTEEPRKAPPGTPRPEAPRRSRS